MPKKLSKVEGEIAEHPERFDYGDVPPARKLIPEQERRLDEMRPDWAKSLSGKQL